MCRIERKCMKQQRDRRSQKETRDSQALAVGKFRRAVPLDQQAEATNDEFEPGEEGLPPTNDAGDAIGEDSLYAASGAATGGGDDLSEAVEESDEEVAAKKKHIHQGTSAYMGGGSDNGSDL